MDDVVRDRRDGVMPLSPRGVQAAGTYGADTSTGQAKVLLLRKHVSQWRWLVAARVWSVTQGGEVAFSEVRSFITDYTGARRQIPQSPNHQSSMNRQSPIASHSMGASL